MKLKNHSLLSIFMIKCRKIKKTSHYSTRFIFVIVSLLLLLYIHCIKSPKMSILKAITVATAVWTIERLQLHGKRGKIHVGPRE